MECASLSGMCSDVGTERWIAFRRTVENINQKLVEVMVLEEMSLSLYNTSILSG